MTNTPDETVSLQELIDIIEAPTSASPEAAADLLYFQQEYRAAASAYRALEDKSVRIEEKLGASLQHAGDNLAARGVFRPIEDNLSPIGKVIFSQALFASVSRWKGRDGYEDEPEEGMRVLMSVLDLEVPPHFAFVVASRNRYHWKDGEERARIGEQIIRGAEVYPTSEELLLNADRVRQVAQISPAESIKHLLKFATDVGITPRLLWTIHERYRGINQPQEALRWLTEAINCQRRHSGPSETLGVLLAQRAEMRIQSEDYPSAIVDSVEACELCTESNARMATSLIACLASLKTDNRAGAERAAAVFLETLLTEKQLSWFLASEIYCRIGDENWSEFEIVSLDLRMAAFVDLLEHLSNPIHQGWFRYLIASEVVHEASVEDSDAEPNWAALSRILGDAAKLTQHHPHVEALDVRVRSELPRANWSNLGYRWAAAQIAIHAADGTDTAATDLPSHLYADSSKRDQFFTGIVKALKASSPSPHAFDVLEGSEILQYLVEQSMAHVMYDMLSSICPNDRRADPLFFLGWSAQTANLRSEAFQAYFALLDQDPGAATAITNALLMCDNESMASHLEELRQHIAAFKSAVDDENQHAKVDAARQRCLSKRSRLTATLIDAMRGYAPLGDRSATLEDLTLLDAVTLVALLRTSPPAGDQLFIPRVSTGNIPFARLSEQWRGFFALMEFGLIFPGQETDPASIKRVESSSYSWVFPQIDWHISPHAMSLADKVRVIPYDGKWPQHWSGAARLLAVDFAREEIATYLDEQATARNWPEPDRDDRFQQLLAMLVERVSVAEAYYLVYLGAMSAADNKAKHPISATQASNLMVKRTGERLDRVVSGDLMPKPYNRSWNSPRTQMHMALWEDVLGMGDAGFTNRLAQVKFPGERANRKKRS